jgi:alcohol dehydrogenase, propanol-preferring
MDAAILFAPVGAPIPQALRHTAKGATVVCAGIHMSNVPEFPRSILWGERSVRSIANLTRRDGKAFLDIAAKAGVSAEVETFPLASANEAL